MKKKSPLFIRISEAKSTRTSISLRHFFFKNRQAQKHAPIHTCSNFLQWDNRFPDFLCQPFKPRNRAKMVIYYTTSTSVPVYVFHYFSHFPLDFWITGPNQNQLLILAGKIDFNQTVWCTLETKVNNTSWIEVENRDVTKGFFNRFFNELVRIIFHKGLKMKLFVVYPWNAQNALCEATSSFTCGCLADRCLLCKQVQKRDVNYLPAKPDLRPITCKIRYNQTRNILRSEFEKTDALTSEA